MINCEIELDLTWLKYCIISEVSRTFREVDANADPVVHEAAAAATGTTLQIENAKLYIPVVTLSINDNIKFLEKIKQGFKRTISSNKYRSEITTQEKNNNLGYLIDPTFRNINRLFALSFKNGDYKPLVEIKDFNALIDNKMFFDQPVKINKKRTKSLLKWKEMSTTQQEIY